MSEEKQKNANRKVEWSFDFGNVTESFSNFINSLGGDEELTTSEFMVAKEGVESARININFSVGQSFVEALAAGSNALFEATIQHVGELEFSEEGTSTKTVKLQQKRKVEFSANPIKQGFRAIANREDLRWDIRLAPDVPLSLDIDGGVGPTKLDLGGLQLRSLKVDTGVGTLDVILPQQTAKIEADIDGGIGQTKIHIPENGDVTLHVDGGVGEVVVTVPPDAAVQVKAEGGIGSVNVPKSFKRMTKKDALDRGGMWQSEGFDLAERRIAIRYSGGVGQFSVREAEIV